MDTTLLKGLKMLELLAHSEKSRGIGDLVRELGLPKSNVHRTLSTLASAGYVDQDENGKYECTLKLFELGSLITDRIDVRAKAEASMEKLAQLSREAVHLAVLEDTEVIYLAKIESPEPIRAYSRVGGRAPAHCVASGKALLAYQGADYLERFDAELDSTTEQTITSRAELARALASVRAQRVAINNGEWRAEVGGIGAVVLDHANTPIAAIGVSGPIERVRRNLDANTAAVIEAARTVSTAMGCRDYLQQISDWKGN